MNIGKTLFAQVMEFVPWKSFGRSIAKHQGDSGVRTLSCADLFRVWRFPNSRGASRCVTSRLAWQPIGPSCSTWAWLSRPLDPRWPMR
jgi:hypothetical protein